MLQHVAEQRLGNAHRARQPHVGSVKVVTSGMRASPPTQVPTTPFGKPPVSVDDVGLEAPPCSNRVDEIGAEEADEREPRAPGGRNILRHVSRVRELLVAARRIAKALDRNPGDLFRSRESGGRRSHDVDVHIFARRAMASRSRNEPGASPSDRGNECVRNRTFICSAIRGRVAILREILEPRPKLAHLRALRRDELADQSRREEHASEDETSLDQIESGRKPDPADDAPEDGDDPDDHAEDEQRCAEHAEQQQRLLARSAARTTRQACRARRPGFCRSRTSIGRHGGGKAEPGLRKPRIPAAAAITTMYRCQSGRAGSASITSRRYALTELRSRTGTLNNERLSRL